MNQGLKLISLIPGCGYGDAACEYAAGLDGLGYLVSWMPVRDDSADLLSLAQATRDVPRPLYTKMCRLWDRSIEAEAFLLDVPPYRWHEHWLKSEPQLRPYCYLAWEADRVPTKWLAPINCYETVFVPSHANKETFEAGGVTTRIKVLPHVARELGCGVTDAEGALDLGTVSDEDFVFYTIGAWTSRKAMEQTIRAYLDAFSATDSVALVIKTESFNQVKLRQASSKQRSGKAAQRLTTAWAAARILTDYTNPARIHLISGRISSPQIDRLHQRGDCFISLTHSEGWGLGAFDAALAANPVIITGWGGQLDYLGGDYPLLVEYSLRSTGLYPDDGFFYRADDVQWAEADREHAISLMRSVFNDPAGAAEIAADLKPGLKSRFAAARVCAELATAMGLDPHIAPERTKE